MLKVLLSLSLFFIFYTYIFYPLIIWAMNGRFSKKDHKIDEEQFPFVSFLVVAYNEEQVIKEKIENTLLLEYPKDKLKIIFASDYSTDGTNGIIEKYKKEGIHFVPIGRRGGKSKALNICIPQAKGEIIVLSDANTFVQKDAIKKLVRHFVDPVIGCVSGKLRFRPVHGNPLGMIESSFWNYETWVKMKEGNIASVPGANGGIYAIRKSVFQFLPIDKAIMDDFLITLKIIQQGYRAISDPEVRALEDTCLNVQDSFEQKVRIGAGNFHGLRYIMPLLNPSQGLVAYILWSHKIIRWFLPFLLIIAFITNMVLINSGTVYRCLAVGQLSFYFVAGLGFFFYMISKLEKVFVSK